MRTLVGLIVAAMLGWAVLLGSILYLAQAILPVIGLR